MAASSNLFDTNTSTATLPPPPYYAGILDVVGLDGGEQQQQQHDGEEESEEDAATWAALIRPANSGSASSSLSENDEDEDEGGGAGLVARRLSSALAASARIGEWAATPGEMRRGMGLALTPRGFELEDDWDEAYYYYYSDLTDEYGWAPRGGLSERARRRLPTSQATAAELGDCSICQDDITTECDVTRLPCGGGRHFYHAGCVDRWLQTSNTCPDCRHIIPEGGDGEGEALAQQREEATA